ncbi:hypothetical protein QBC34DRAFT_379078 [Podospora aff. communis PSN243]|uniref:MARVEL domain-containing protein n=1 Tax=Podospora aff. communis PSN243 TaxID=3040156 RepID=A0AAV9GS57_9PEZI|nr:hypothetical protein QBC34DRAFT_379078 [Podospora aff. communis PSN243]
MDPRGPSLRRDEPLDVLPMPYKAPPPYQYRPHPILAPPPKKVSVDWLVLIPHYHRYLYAKLCLAGMAGAVAIAVIVLTKTFGDRLALYRNPAAFLHSDSITYGAAALAIIWALFEFMVIFLFTPRDFPRRGIHPGGHLLFHLTIWILALYAVIENANYLKARGRRRDNLFIPGTPRPAKDEIAGLQKALLGSLVALVTIEIILFCRACWETWQVNSEKHSPPVIRLGTVSGQRLGEEPVDPPATRVGPYGPFNSQALSGAGAYRPLAGENDLSDNPQWPLTGDVPVAQPHNAHVGPSTPAGEFYAPSSQPPRVPGQSPSQYAEGPGRSLYR